MLAALLLNLGSQVPQVPVGTQFGGGPFWRRYGYDSAYDEIRDQTTTGALESIPAPELVRSSLPYRAEQKVNYKAINAKVSNSVVEEMHRLRKELETAREDFEDELMIFLLGE